MPSIFPTPAAGKENIILWAKVGTDWPFFGLASRCLVDVLPQGGSQCFPFYTYDEDGTNRRENITDWALGHFREHYGDEKITKWDIFYYVYGILHHPEYRAKYAENLKRELPRIPLAGAVILRSPSDDGRTKNLGSSPRQNAEILRSAQDDKKGTAPHDNEAGAQHDRNVFWAFAKAGKELAQLHIDYEKVAPYPLKYVETTVAAGFSPARAALKGGATVAAVSDRRKKRNAGETPALQSKPLSYRVEDKMRLAKDRKSLKVNDTLTLAGIPPEAFEYRLGNRSALEWVIDQYQVTEDKRSGIRSDPNRADDPEYIVKLVGRVIRVSLETVRTVNALPKI